MASSWAAGACRYRFASMIVMKNFQLFAFSGCVQRCEKVGHRCLFLQISQCGDHNYIVVNTFKQGVRRM
eukprot:5366554-Pleurochrysis_carterae.AAC.1